MSKEPPPPSFQTILSIRRHLCIARVPRNTIRGLILLYTLHSARAYLPPPKFPILIQYRSSPLASFLSSSFSLGYLVAFDNLSLDTCHCISYLRLSKAVMTIRRSRRTRNRRSFVVKYTHVYVTNDQLGRFVPIEKNPPSLSRGRMSFMDIHELFESRSAQLTQDLSARRSNNLARNSGRDSGRRKACSIDSLAKCVLIRSNTLPNYPCDIFDQEDSRGR